MRTVVCRVEATKSIVRVISGQEVSPKTRKPPEMNLQGRPRGEGDVEAFNRLEPHVLTSRSRWRTAASFFRAGSKRIRDGMLMAGFMLDQQRLRSLTTIDDLPDDDADVAAFLARVRLDRLAPASV